jgi:hypothetical protein
VAAVDEIASGRERAPSLLRLVALGVVLALVAGGVAVLRWERQRQLDARISAASSAERVVSDQRRSLAGLFRYSEALLGRSDTQPAQRAAVLASFSADAARFRPRIAAPRAAVAEVRPLPWDADLAAARPACLARIDAWSAAVEAGRDDPDLLLAEPRDTRAARARAADALETAAGSSGGEALKALTRSLRTG